ncbi:hypothetical protein CVM50_01710 [Pseudooceanicola marinus]|nr:hypothetical protein CVM50_01710 [Pseudooceanicola marinus]
MPGLSDERFANTVIVLCAHSDEGAMGLVVNKPADHVSLPSLLDQLEIPRCADLSGRSVYAGGPVEMERGFVLHSPDYDTEMSTLQVNEQFAMTATLDVLEDIAAGQGPMLAMVALGYCGWAPGQLEDEIAQNGWLVGDPTGGLVFEAEDDRKWDLAMSSLGIDPLSLSAVAGRA